MTLKWLTFPPLSPLSFLPGRLCSLCLSCHLTSPNSSLKTLSVIYSEGLQGFSRLVGHPPLWGPESLVPLLEHTPDCPERVHLSVGSYHELVTDSLAHGSQESFVNKRLEAADLGLKPALFLVCCCFLAV